MTTRGRGKAGKDLSGFVARRHGSDPASETIARGRDYNPTHDAAMTYLMESGRDYEYFDVVELDRDGDVVDRDWGGVSWAPRG